MTPKDFIAHLESQGWTQKESPKSFEDMKIFIHEDSYQCICWDEDCYVEIKSIGNRGQPIGESPIYADLRHVEIRNGELVHVRKFPITFTHGRKKLVEKYEEKNDQN